MGVGGVMGYGGAEQDTSGGADIVTTDPTSLRPHRPMYGGEQEEVVSPGEGNVKGIGVSICAHAEGRGTRAP